MSNISDDLPPIGPDSAGDGVARTGAAWQRLRQHEADLLFSAVPPEVVEAQRPELRKRSTTFLSKSRW
jgi:hypothetical protein